MAFPSFVFFLSDLHHKCLCQVFERRETPSQRLNTKPRTNIDWTQEPNTSIKWASCYPDVLQSIGDSFITAISSQTKERLCFAHFEGVADSVVVHSPHLYAGQRGIGSQSATVWMWVCTVVYPVTDWWPVQGLVSLLPEVSWAPATPMTLFKISCVGNGCNTASLHLWL